jgi:hypothetical protein
MHYKKYMQNKKPLDYTRNKNICKHKRHLSVDSRSSNSPYMRAYYIKYCNILSRDIKEAKRQHYCRLIAKSNNQIKQLGK